MEFIEMGSADAQSLYAGRKPNCIRIYNKVAEWEHRWRKMARAYERFISQMEKFEMTDEQAYYGMRIPPTFQEFCRWEGFEYQEGDILTRVERQIGGDRFPNGLHTFSDLRKLDIFNPFSALQIVGKRGPSPMPDPSSIPIRDLLAIKGLQRLVEERGGAQPAFAFVQKYANGNGKRIIDKFGQFILPDDSPGITEKDVVETYRQSVLPQISA